jgi:hypothetical protein
VEFTQPYPSSLSRAIKYMYNYDVSKFILFQLSGTTQSLSILKWILKRQPNGKGRNNILNIALEANNEPAIHWLIDVYKASPDDISLYKTTLHSSFSTFLKIFKYHQNNIYPISDFLTFLFVASISTNQYKKAKWIYLNYKLDPRFINGEVDKLITKPNSLKTIKFFMHLFPFKICDYRRRGALPTSVKWILKHRFDGLKIDL